MAENSYPYDSGPGATITEDQWSHMAGAWQDDGVQAAGPWQADLKVTSANEALILHIESGHATLSGMHYHLDADKTIAFAANPSSNDRLDRIVLKLDRATNVISFVVKQGTAASSPVAPGVDRSWSSPEINIATFRVRGSSSSVLPLEVYDERDFIGRYIKVTENASLVPQGGIRYSQAEDEFWMGGVTPFRIGRWVHNHDFSYSALGHTHDYSPSGHNHNSAYASLSHVHNTGTNVATFTPSSGYTTLQNQLFTWARFATLSIVMTPNSGTISAGTVIGVIATTSARPSGQYHFTGYQNDNGGSAHGPVRVTVETNGNVVFNGGTQAWINTRYIHIGATYICNGTSPW